MIRSGSPPVRRRRAAGLSGLVAAALVAGTLPAFAHAQFVGLPGASEAQAYPAGSTQAMTIKGDNEAGTVDTATFEIRIPTGWTASCTGASVHEDSAAAAAATNWSCDAVSVAGAPHLRFSNATPSNSSTILSFFVKFPTTAPSPTTAIAYGAGSPGDGSPQGWKVTQSYPTGQRDVWRTPNEAADTTASSDLVVASLVRWVAGGAAGPTPTPVPTTGPSPTPVPTTEPSPTPIPTTGPSPTATPAPGTTVGTQSVTAEIPAAPQEFSISFAGTTVALTPGEATAGHLPFTGALNAVTLKDTRTAAPAWSISGVTADFATGTAALPDSAKYLGWTPQVQTPGAGAVAGPAVAGALAPTAGPGLKTPQSLASAPSGHPAGTAVLGAGLDLRLPTGIPGGTYSSVLTITAI